MSTPLEQAARTAWRAWAWYRKWTRCWDCQEFAYCGAARRGGPFLCVDCHDLRGGR